MLSIQMFTLALALLVLVLRAFLCCMSVIASLWEPDMIPVSPVEHCDVKVIY